MIREELLKSDVKKAILKKVRYKIYRASDRGKDACKEYEASQAGKAAQRKYAESEKGKFMRAKQSKRKGSKRDNL